jgi:ribosomal protein S18 acetylase RimI-like enzyme
MITYQELIYDEKAILSLYLKNGWTAYTSNKELLFKGIKHSLYTLGAYQNNTLIGLIRVIGDKNTIVYIQDILVEPKCQHQGIGTILINSIVERYAHVRQIVLMTDQSKLQTDFYERNGFVSMRNQQVQGYVYKK